MITVQADKEFSLTAHIYDDYHQLADPEQQEIILKDPNDMTQLTLMTPERLGTGIYRATIKLPDDAQEGIWHIVWTSIIYGRETTEVTDIMVKHDVVREVNYEVNIRMRKLSLELDGSSLILQRDNRKILVDLGEGKMLPEGVTDILLSHAHPDHAFGLKDKDLPMTVHMNKFTNRLLSQEDFPFRRRIFWTKPFNIGDIKITPLSVLHSMKSPASGFIFQTNDWKITYLPDVLEVKNLDALRHSNLYIGDGTALDKDIIFRKSGTRIGHASIRTQLQWLKDLGITRAAFSHYGEWAKSDLIAKAFEALSNEFSIKVRDLQRAVIRDKIYLLQRKPKLQITKNLAALISGMQNIKETTVHLGVQKPYFKEFFVRSERFNGRWIIQRIENPWKDYEPNAKVIHLMTKPKDQTPFVLSSQAIREKYVPPYGVSCLPPSIRNIIPDKFKYWDRRNIIERLTARNELVKAINTEEIRLRFI